MIREGRDDPSSGARADAERIGDLASGQHASVKQRFEDGARFRRQASERDFFFGPELDSDTQLLRLHQLLHEAYLVKTRFEKELGKLRECLFAEVATAVEIVTTRQFAVREALLVFLGAAREAARDGPDAASIERFQQRCVRHEPNDATVSVEKRMYP